MVSLSFSFTIIVLIYIPNFTTNFLYFCFDKFIDSYIQLKLYCLIYLSFRLKYWKQDSHFDEFIDFICLN